jgi:hypothetical protein
MRFRLHTMLIVVLIVAFTLGGIQARRRRVANRLEAAHHEELEREHLINTGDLLRFTRESNIKWLDRHLEMAKSDDPEKRDYELGKCREISRSIDFLIRDIERERALAVEEAAKREDFLRRLW